MFFSLLRVIADKIMYNKNNQRNVGSISPATKTKASDTRSLVGNISEAQQ